MDELLGEFLAETGESLDRVDLELARFEQEPDNAEMLNAIFRLVHTVKGTCGFIGLQRLAKLAHAAETLIGQYRGRTQVTVEGVSLVLATIDRIKHIVSRSVASSMDSSSTRSATRFGFRLPPTMSTPSISTHAGRAFAPACIGSITA